MEPQIIILLLLAGCAAGFTAGLLGVGGGLIVVPMALWALEWQQLKIEHAQQVAIATSFGVMIFTTFMSMLAQHKRKAINWLVVRAMLFGSGVGVLSGAVVAGYLSSVGLQIFFVIFCYAIAIRTFFQRQLETANQQQAIKTKSSALPPTWGLSSASGGVGLVSSLLGIGGGVLNVPLLLFFKVPIKNAIGISTAMTFFIAVFGFIGYVYSGWQVSGLPPYSLGYCNLPMVACFALTTVIFAPLGVKVSHQLPDSMLKKCFAILVAIVATKMLWGLLAN